MGSKRTGISKKRTYVVLFAVFAAVMYVIGFSEVFAEVASGSAEPSDSTASVSREAKVQIGALQAQLKARETALSAATAKQERADCPVCPACPAKATKVQKVHPATKPEDAKLGMSATQVTAPKHAPVRHPGAKEFDPDAGIKLQPRLAVSTAEALLKEAQVGKPTVFLVKGQHKGANQQLYGFIPAGAARNPTLGYTLGGNMLDWGEEDAVKKDALEVSQGPYGAVSVNNAGDACFPEDRYRKSELRMWDFGKFQAKGYAFPLIGPAPWLCLSEELKSFYLSNAEHLIESKPKGPSPNRTLLKDWYIGGEAYSDSDAYATWTKEEVEEGIERCGRPPYQCGATYDEGARVVRRTLFAQPVKGLSGLVLGSLTPWAEGILLLHGATKTTTAEYSIIKAEDPRTQYVHIFDIIAKPVKYDFVFSYSSLEHDGLGRFGDPWHPNGDMETFARIHDHWLKPGGKLYLALPTGADILNWNSHRVYGKIRWNRIIKLRSWKLVGMFGGDEYKDPTACQGNPCGSTEPWIRPGVCDADCVWDFSQKLADRTGEDDSFQPIFVLQKAGNEVKWPPPVENPPPMGPSGDVAGE